MIDYYAHMAVFEKIKATLGAETISSPVLAKARDKTIADVSDEEDAALLGCCIDQLILQASADGSELAILETAADLWVRGLNIFNSITGIRNDIETALAYPTLPDALTKFNNAVASLSALRTDAIEILAESKTFTSALSPLSFLRPHPRQADKKINDWDWSNVFMARRGDAFVRSVFENARDSETRSFAFGVLTSYAGNVTGSAYLGHVVGGPRRSHRYRDRLARYSVGAWISMNASVPALKKLARALSYGKATGTIKIPKNIKAALDEAFQTAFFTETTPDFDLGLRRMVRHLELLEIFKCPPEPAPPLDALAPIMSTMSLDDDPGFIGPPVDPGGGAGDPEPTPGTGTPGKADSSTSAGNDCLIGLAIAAIVAGIATLINCIGQWTTTGKCDPTKVNDTTDEPDVSATAQFLTSASSPSTVSTTAHVINELYNYQLSLSECFSSALSYLIVTGLVYPDELYLETPLYAQFTKIPAPLIGWPLRPSSDPGSNLYPTTPVEHPSALPSQYPVGSNPLVFINGIPGTPIPIAWNYANRIWSQVVAGGHDSENLDLDADRGQGHPCWQTAAGTSIGDDPVHVLIIPYKDIKI